MCSRSQNVELVVFDFDGTILDTEWPHFVAVRDTFELYGVELYLEAWQHRVGRADHPHWSQLLVDALDALDAPGVSASGAGVRVAFDLDAMIAECRERKDAATLAEPVRSGVVDLFDRAERAGVAVAVASSSPRDWVESNLERLGLLRRVHAVRTRDDVARAKPWPDVYTAACSAVGVAPVAAVAIEDSHHGLAAAVAAGLPCIVAPNRVLGSGLRTGIARGGLPHRAHERHARPAVAFRRGRSVLRPCPLTGFSPCPEPTLTMIADTHVQSRTEHGRHRGSRP